MLTEDWTHKKCQPSLEIDIKGNEGREEPGLEEARQARGRQGHPTRAPDKVHQYTVEAYPPSI